MTNMGSHQAGRLTTAPISRTVASQGVNDAAAMKAKAS
jgi:hypothetical protein